MFFHMCTWVIACGVPNRVLKYRHNIIYTLQSRFPNLYALTWLTSSTLLRQYNIIIIIITIISILKDRWGRASRKIVCWIVSGIEFVIDRARECARPNILRSTQQRYRYYIPTMFIRSEDITIFLEK